MTSLRLLPLFALGLAAGAQAAPATQKASGPPSPVAMAASAAPLPPLATPSASSAAASVEATGIGEVEWIRTPRPQPSVRDGREGQDDRALNTLRAESSTEWTVELSDQTFRQTLMRWTRVAGWQLVWEVERDFAIDAQVTLQGNFLDALDQAMTSLRETDFPVQARINPHTRVVRVVRYMLDGERR